jgi:transposase
MCGRSKGEHTVSSPIDRGRPGSKHQLITDALGFPLAVTLTGGHRHDVTQLIPLVEAIPPVRGRRGRPARRPRELYADRGYDHDKYRRLLRAAASPRASPAAAPPMDLAWAATGGVIEQAFAWLHAFKRLRTRYEHRADLHLGLLQLACALICHRHLKLSL